MGRARTADAAVKFHTLPHLRLSHRGACGELDPGCGSDPLHLPAVEGEGDVVLRTVNTTSVVFVVRMSSFSPSGPKHNTRGEHSN